MRVYQVENEWTMANLRIGERPIPEPRDGQVRIRMRAAALNYRDSLIPFHGYGKRMQELPLVMLSDGFGIIDALGAGVTRVQLGDRVCPLFYQSWLGGAPANERFRYSLGCEQDGTMADYLVLSAEGVSAAPVHLDDVEAATLPTAAVTAWRSLVTEGNLRPGETVLIQGTGGVSLFALQFAKLLGARAIVTSSSDEKLARVRALGADETVNYRENPQWGKIAREITGGKGVDHVVEVGGAGTLEQSLRAIRTGGTLSMIGVLAGSEPTIPLGQIVTRHIRLQGITVGNRDNFEAMAAAIALHELRPVIDRVFEFEALRSALDYMASGQHFGKICIRHASD
ncbi:NAD(P)-dependent alcohol dehydrogenase [Paraburkholderia sp. CNPSo 3281]|uniref:zinc-dependent alcohol dehydrogenase family protein n=1 Tax=Paraburkholderia sp. CNPSo 3281 TaxID=2940933 RepID=UPI0020B6DB29|nr:NAD(P)-dependent alcohol dehydrogenase [Paraburkholderia sp. CNPSo 3281]MCP3719973.1 NAD(P)-dependent alcohol dehydrogenase [Paraburkholderia sp. CNPSo 3281]